MSAIQGAGLEGFLQFRGWIRGVSTIQGAGLEGFCCSGSYVCRDDSEEI